MLCDPVASVLVEKLAFPETSELDPKSVAPFMNFTVPPGVPVVEDVTVAVNVTDCPETDGFNEETTLVELFALFTTCFSAFDVLPA